jgi:hypothetical protein
VSRRVQPSRRRFGVSREPGNLCVERIQRRARTVNIRRPGQSRVVWGLGLGLEPREGLLMICGEGGSTFLEKDLQRSATKRGEWPPRVLAPRRTSQRAAPPIPSSKRRPRATQLRARSRNPTADSLGGEHARAKHTRARPAPGAARPRTTPSLDWRKAARGPGPGGTRARHRAEPSFARRRSRTWRYRS